MLNFSKIRFTHYWLLVLSLVFPFGPSWGDTKSELVVLTWSDYMDPELVEAFERQHNAQVKFVYFEDDDGRDAMMINGDGKGYDLVLVNDSNLESYQRRGWLAPINLEQVPNQQHIDMRWRNAFPVSQGFAVPYFWGTIGIAYRADLVKQPIKSWAEFFDPPEV